MNDGKKGIVRIKKAFLYMGLLPIGLVLCLLLGAYVSGQLAEWMYYLDSFFILLGTVFILIWVNWRIIYDEEKFVLRNIFRISAL